MIAPVKAFGRRIRTAAAVLLLAPGAAAGPCPSVVFLDRDPGLSEVEKRLVCGDPELDGWRAIPAWQARRFLTAFLQKRGFHFPSFSERGGILEVSVGTQTVISKLTGSGIGRIFDLGKSRGFAGRVLTPEALDRLKQAVLLELQSHGHACPTITLSADPRSGEVRVVVEPGPVSLVRPIPAPPLDKLDPAVVDRFRAFDYNEPLDIRLLSLTSQRIMQEGLFMSAYYDVICSSAGPRFVQHVVAGPPRLMTVGVGADTEGLVRVRARFKNARIGYRASTAEAEVNVSRLEQSLSGAMRYYLRPRDRLHLRPAAFLRREDEPPYQAVHSQGSLAPVWTHDIGDFYIETRGGPALDYFNTIVGLGPTQDSWLSFATWTQVRTHLYEYYQREPRRGWMGTLETMTRVRGAYSSISADRVRVGGTALWNLGHWRPPILVLATRGFIGTLWVGKDGGQAAYSRLPPPDRFFLGGESDLRGIGRKNLPGDQTGFLTAAYDGVELRLGEVLPLKLQPLIFMDAAMAGRHAFQLDPDVYYSPGFGLRWSLPFGAVRATMARGLTWRRGSVTAPPTPRWQFFIALGREF